MNKKDTFCILPFIHFYTQPDGEVKPCCIAGGFENKQLLSKYSIEEIWNSDEYKKLRKDMLDGNRNKVCDVCYKKEDKGEYSPRHMYNDNPTYNMPTVNDDYSVNTSFQHIDIRFSNLCNFKCRMCNHTFSSHWYEDSKKIKVGNSYIYKSGTDTKVVEPSKNIVDDIIPYISNIRTVYFAGGEPLINEQHYKLLKWMNEIESICNRVSIHYNTNLSIMKYKNYNFIDYWSKFKRVHVAVSCDGVGKVGEYQRVGFNHNTFIKNLTELKKYGKSSSTVEDVYGITYSFQYTVTIFNIEHIFDFIDFMKSNGFIDSEDCIDFYYAFGPLITVNNISDDDKARITNMFNENMKKISSEKTINQLNTLLNHMNGPTTIGENLVRELIDKLDELNNTSYEDVTSIRLG
jgi:MoaA/NifB/PqqE/SkfB family radical SAM enzyme